MNIELFEGYYKLEDNYWWFVGMRDIFYRLIKNIYSGRNNLSILDVGCGTGKIINEIEKLGKVTGLDVEPQALKFCKARGINRLVLAEGNFLPFKDETFDLITALNIIEHIADDDGFVKDMHRVCKINGRVILSTSAFNFLWSKHDLVNNHKRRYVKREIRDLLGKYFILEKVTYTNFFLFLIIWTGVILTNLLEKRDSEISHGFYHVPKFINRVLITILRMESVILKKINFPFGVSLLCVAKR